LQVSVGVILNTSLYDLCPELPAALVAAGDEIIGHGHTHAERQGTMRDDDERALQHDCAPHIERESPRICCRRRAAVTR
jgi:allantoinase